MTFADIPAGSAVFLDADMSSLYYFAPESDIRASYVEELMERVSRGEIAGFHFEPCSGRRRTPPDDLARQPDMYGWPMTGIASTACSGTLPSLGSLTRFPPGG